MMHLIFLYLKILISIPFLIIIVILYPIIKIKIIEIETRSIGAFTIPIENFLAEIHHGYIKKKRTIFLCFTNKRITNYFILEKWKKYFYIKNFFILEIIFKILTKYYFIGRFFLPYRHWKNHKVWHSRDIFNLLPKTKPFITFNNREIDLGRSLLNKLGIKDLNKYFCFFSRSHDYRAQFDVAEEEKGSCRNSSILDQLKGVQLIVNENLKAVRVGSVVSEKLNINNPNIIDYSNSALRSEFLDVFLIFHCNFMISTGSGIDFLATLNRKKILYVNYCGLENLHNIPNDLYYPIFLPKKYFDLKTKKLLTFKKIFEARLHNDSFYTKDLENIGVVLIDNTQDEIKDAILEMYEFITSKEETAFKNDIANEEFWNIYKFYHDGFRPPNMKISKKFLHANKCLLE